jgi:Flp pilus assembly protein CpaB
MSPARTDPSAWSAPDLRDRAARRLRVVRRAVLRRRRPLAALCAAAAVTLAVVSVRPPSPLTVDVRVATRDLGAGEVLTAADLRTQRFPRRLAPAGADGPLLGRALAAPVRRGEPVTDVRLVGASLVAGHADLVAVPVRLPDAESVALLRVGDRIDLHAAAADGSPARLLLTAAPVLALPPPGGVDAHEGRLVVLGAPPAEVDTVVAAAVRQFLAYSFSR